MRMQKEEKVVVMLLLMALCSLAVAEWTFFDSDQITRESDSSISLTGHILDMKPTKTGGNLIFHLDTTNLSIYVPRDSGAKDIQNRIHPGDQVKIRGAISVFNGKKEIKIERSGDLEVTKSAF